MRFRDRMKTVSEIGNFYPGGYVVFTSELPTGSQLNFAVTSR